MTTKNAEKQLARERVKKTGESYTSALAQVRKLRASELRKNTDLICTNKHEGQPNERGSQARLMPDLLLTLLREMRAALSQAHVAADARLSATEAARRGEHLIALLGFEWNDLTGYAHRIRPPDMGCARCGEPALSPNTAEDIAEDIAQALTMLASARRNYELSWRNMIGQALRVTVHALADLGDRSALHETYPAIENDFEAGGVCFSLDRTQSADFGRSLIATFSVDGIHALTLEVSARLLGLDIQRASDGDRARNVARVWPRARPVVAQILGGNPAWPAIVKGRVKVLSRTTTFEFEEPREVPAPDA